MIQMQNGHMDRMDDVIKVMRVLADPTRLRVLTMLQENELNVSTLCGHLDLAQPTVSHHLGLLRSMGLVNTRRDGKQVFYSLNREHVESLSDDQGISIAAGSMELRLLKAG